MHLLSSRSQHLPQRCWKRSPSRPEGGRRVFQDLPLSITAITADTMQTMGIYDVKDIHDFVPNVNVSRDGWPRLGRTFHSRHRRGRQRRRHEVVGIRCLSRRPLPRCTY